MNKQEIATQWKKHKTITARSLGAQYNNTRTCVEFYNGDTMTYTDRMQFVDSTGSKKRAMVQFNKIKPNVEAVCGFMAQNRRQAKYLARLNASTSQILYSRYMNALCEYIRDNANADQIETDQDFDMLINGYGVIETDISYIQGNSTTDPNGEIVYERLDPLCVGWDPHAKAKNLLDARWAYYWQEYDLKEALSLFDKSKEEDFQFVSEDNAVDGGYNYNPYGGRYDKIKMDDTVEWANKAEEMVRVYNYQWTEYETYYRAKNPLFTLTNPTAVMVAQAKLQIIQSEQETNGPDNIDAGSMFDFDMTKEELCFDEATKRKLVEGFGNLIQPIPFKRKCFYTAVISGSHVFTTFKSICQQSFSIKFKTGVYDASRKVWVGMVNSMMEPAKYYNKALTELMFTIASNSKGGVMVERSAVEDINDFSSKYAKTDGVIVVEDGALSGNKIQDKTKPAMPSGLENLIMLTDAAVADTSGVDRSFLGSRENGPEQSGILYKRRIRQIISTMARYMDSVTLYQKEQARLLADYIRVWVENNDGAMFRITGEQGQEEFAAIASDKLAPEYDVTIQEAPQTPEDQQETAELLSTIGDKYLAVGDATTAKAFHAEAIQNINIDGEAKSRLLQILQPQGEDPQVVQLKQEIERLNSAITQAEVARVQSETALNTARIAKEQASTAKTLEDAANTGLENDIIRSGGYEKATVSI